MYNVIIKNCNNIADGHISIIPNKLNVKYGINGTGKSTVAKAIMSSGKSELQTLKSYFAEEDASVSVQPSCSRILVFNEEFVNQVVFNDNEVIKNSFEVFLKTPNYDEKKAKVDSLLAKLHGTVIGSDKIAKFQHTIDELNEKFKRSQSGELAKTGVYKSLLSKQNIYNVPEELKSFKPFFDNSDINIPWIDWKNKGDDYDIGDRCPYCSEPIDRPSQDRRKSVFKKTYKKTDSQNLKDVLFALKELQDYFAPEKYESLISYIKQDTSSDIIAAIFKKLTVEFEVVQMRFRAISSFGNSGIVETDIGKIEQHIDNMKFPVPFFEYLCSDQAKEIYEQINNQVQILKNEVAQIKREMGALKGILLATIQDSQQDINEFLRTAGIHYEILLDAEDESHSKAVLRQCFSKEKTEVQQIREHLSWGEKNAFALVLFMYYAVKQNPEIIILDDPISSFDSNKKYAIMHRMFKDVGKKDVSFVDRTVLLLTHDFEPVIDFLLVGRIDAKRVTSTFIWNEKRVLREVNIDPNTDVKLLYDECAESAKCSTLNIISRIAFLRKLCELNGCRNEWGYAYEILSSLIHGKEVRRKVANDTFVPMPKTERDAGLALIIVYIPDFCFDSLLKNTYTVAAVKKLYLSESNSYLKIQLFREVTELASAQDIRLKPMDEAWFKYIDETYHIENDYIHYLDVSKFNVVPDYIIEIVDAMMGQL
jgi:ABC-type Mn2+/Zn2+ transport system ATPase subunit